ncbi:aminodeoxychorismate lyase [Acinetobacter sp. ANC 5502]
MQCFKNALAQPQVSLLDRAFHYGDGCFTTAKILQNKIQLRDRHLQRLQECCQRMALQVDLALIDQTLEQLSAQAELNGTLKIIISRGEGQRGYALLDHPADVYVFYYPQTKAADCSFSYVSQVDILDQRVGLTMPQLCGLKTLNRLEQVLLKKEAVEKQLDEALVLDIQGRIVEGISSNCFILMNNRWVTPDLEYNGVRGVMRAEILQRMQHAGIECSEMELLQTDLHQIDALFFCNALHPMQIAQHLMNTNLSTSHAIQLFKDLQLDQIQ